MAQTPQPGVNRAWIIALIFPLLLCLSCGAPELPAPEAVFLVVVDTLPADSLSCYGAGERSTPNIDRLAAHGVTFANAHSPSSWTRPAMGSIMTSQHPTRIGLVEQEAGKGKAFGPRQRRKQVGHRMMGHEKSLAGFMNEAGFLTAAFVNQPGLSANRGFKRDFSDYYYPVSLGRIRRLQRDETFGGQPQQWGSTRDALANDEALVDTFVHWLQALPREPDSTAGKKIAVWLHLLAPHRPYVPPEHFAPEAQEDPFRFLSARHRGEVMAEDVLVGKALDAIERYVGMERSLILICSDHGEEFGEHGSEEHGHSLHGEVIRVPLIIRSPGLPRGVVVQRQVSTIDILPTILDLTGTSPARGPGPDERFAGRSLKPLLPGSRPGREGLPLYAEGMLYGGTKRSLVIDDHKLIFDQQQDRWYLYNIELDPGETEDLAQSRPELVAGMRRQLEMIHRKNVEDAAAMPREGENSQDEADRRRTEKALEALGYIGE